MANGGAAGAAAAIANALKAMGVVVAVEPAEFLQILGRCEQPMVVHSPRAFLTKHKYLTSYRGFCFFTQSGEELLIPLSVEIVESKKIFVPVM